MKRVFCFFCFNLVCFGFSFPFKKNTSIHTPELKKIRIGFFPNITHPHALVAQALAKEGKDWFTDYLPSGYKVEWFRFNAGPTAMEGLITHAIDLSYVGPNPALNTYLRSKGKEVRLLSGAIRGGAGLVVKKDLAQKPLKDWNGNMWLVMFIDNLDVSFDNSWGMGMATLTGHWVEVGNATDENDLYDMGLVTLGGE